MISFASMSQLVLRVQLVLHVQHALHVQLVLHVQPDLHVPHLGAVTEFTYITHI